MKVGDKVRYMGKIWTIEKKYKGCNVFFIGNRHSWCDCVHANELKLVKKKKSNDNL